MSENEENLPFFQPWRVIALIIWGVSLFLVPFILEKLGWVPDGAGFVPGTLLFLVLFGIVFDKFSFRVALAIVFVCAMGSLYKPDVVSKVVDGLDFRMQDAFFNLRGPKKPSKQVVIVDIDSKSLDTFGQWPWPRSQVAGVVRNLTADGARVIGFDIVFAEKDRLSLGQWENRLKTAGIVRQNEKVGLTPISGVGLDIGVQSVKKIVLQDWRRRLEDLDPNFFVDDSLPPEAQEKLIVEKYLEIDKIRWKEREKEFFDRAKRVGIYYEMKPYPPLMSPLESMAKASRELFYFGHRWNAKELFSKGANVVMNNDWELGYSFQDRKVVSGGLFITRTSAGTKVSPYLRKEASVESTGMIVSTGISGAREVFPGLRKALRQVLNVPEVQEMAYHQGMFNIVPDQSGAARYYTMLMDAPVFQQTLVLKEDFKDQPNLDIMNLDNYESKIVAQYFTYPSLALEMLRVANGYDQIFLGHQDELPGVFLERDRGFIYTNSEEEQKLLETYYTESAFKNILPEKRFIPLDFKGDILVNFYGFGGKWEPESNHEPDYYFPYYSVSDIVQGNFPPGTFKDKYVLIGSTDPTLSDLVGSPFRPAFPGLEVHATILDNLITNDILVDLGKWETLYLFFGITFLGLIIAFAVAYSPAWSAALTTFTVLTALPFISFWGIASAGFVFHFVYPWLFAAFLTLVIVTINFFVEGKDRRFVVSQFEKMVSGDVLAKLRQDPEGVSLGGQRTEVSVLFSDVKGFTSISEKMSPQKLVMLLNDYLTPMTDIILSHEGFIDKFIGDAIMACWGVPFSDADHARHCCRAALEQQKALVGISKELREKYDADISVRIGISTGEASAALMGSESRKSYTVMGDTVNLGARLEPACADYGAGILISENTYKAVRGDFETKLVDKLVVKGKTISIPIYELIGIKGEVPPEVINKNRLFEEALELHWNRKWTTAEMKLNELLAVNPDDVAAKKLLERIQLYRSNPPPDGWDGGFVKTTK